MTKKGKTTETPAGAPASNSAELNDKSSPSDEGLVDKSVGGGSELDPSVVERASVQVLVRVSEGVRSEWQRVAASVGESMSEFVRVAVGDRVRVLTECEHRREWLQVYRWQTTCLRCGVRIVEEGAAPMSSTGDVAR